MSRYRLTISCEFDTEKPMIDHDEIARNIINTCCPINFNLFGSECDMSTCSKCWFKALEGGVKKGGKSVHVERLD